MLFRHARGWSLLEDLYFTVDAITTEPLEKIQQAARFSFTVFFGIDAPIHRERTLFRYEIEVRAAAAFAAHHQDRAPRRSWTDLKSGFALLDFASQLIQLTRNN